MQVHDLEQAFGTAFAKLSVQLTPCVVLDHDRPMESPLAVMPVILEKMVHAHGKHFYHAAEKLRQPLSG